jgi:type VI secretion system protein ImpC
MAKPLSFGNVGIELTAGFGPSGGSARSEGQFRMAVLGDFSGRASRGLRQTGAQLAGRRPLAVDRDNFEEVMARLGVEIHLPVAGPEGGGITIPIKELDDFRPDRLFQQVGAFASLRQTRDQLKNPRTFAATAAKVRSWAKPASEPQVPTSPEGPTGGPVSTSPDQLLDQILGGSAGPSERPSSGSSVDWNAFLQNVIAPYVVPRADPLQAELVDQVDAATGGLMRAILHQPEFQRLEAAWRSLYFLVRRLDTDQQLKLFLIDISRDELAEDLGAIEDLQATGLYRLLVEQTVGTPGATPWSLLVGNYTFGPQPAEVELVGRLAKVAGQAGAPLLAGASPVVVGVRSLTETPDPDDWPRALDKESQAAWQALRQLPEASSVGLALPRFLLRLPYGKDTDPSEVIPFEELPAANPHEAYLWGNPAFAWAYLVGQAFNRQGWEMRLGELREIDGLPVHVYHQAGDTETKPCAEVVLTHRAADRIKAQGVMPLLSVKNGDSAILAGFQSVADPPRPLAGRWLRS